MKRSRSRRTHGEHQKNDDSILTRSMQYHVLHLRLLVLWRRKMDYGSATILKAHA